MSALLFLLRAVFLVLLWGLVRAAVLAVRRDVFGAKTKAKAGGGGRSAAAPAPAKGGRDRSARGAAAGARPRGRGGGGGAPPAGRHRRPARRHQPAARPDTRDDRAGRRLHARRERRLR